MNPFAIDKETIQKWLAAYKPPTHGIRIKGRDHCPMSVTGEHDLIHEPYGASRCLVCGQLNLPKGVTSY